MNVIKSLLTLALMSGSSAMAAEPVVPNGAPVRIGTLASGTLNWEMATVRNEGLDQANSIRLVASNLASPEAGRIGLQGKSLDVIVSDWIWVARQRQQGEGFVFAPFSGSHGALMVPADSPIRGVGDLAGKRLGVAGGGLDKNWLLLKAMARQTGQPDPEQTAKVSFAAPPLLNQELQQGRLDAVLTYWNYAARLEAQGYRQVLDGRQIQKALGIESDVPALGYVFREGWARANPPAITGFLKAAAQARKSLCQSDASWQKVIPLTQESDGRIQSALRRHYCAGSVADHLGAGELKAAQEIFRQVGGAAPGNDATLPAGVFWNAGSGSVETR